jgi:hypothetical protein
MENIGWVVEKRGVAAIYFLVGIFFFASTPMKLVRDPTARIALQQIKKMKRTPA